MPEQANEAIVRMQQLGFRPEEVIVAKEVSEVEQLMQSESDMTRSTLLGAGYGAVVGCLLGLGQMAYIGSGIWSMWGAAGIPIVNAGCWALVGTIVGCGGILVRKRVSSEVEHRFESEVGREKLLVAVPLRDGHQLSAVRASLSAVGATNIHYSGKVA